jgi:hypothetical protein
MSLALDQFKLILEHDQLYTPQSSHAPASHDDATLMYVIFFFSFYDTVHTSSTSRFLRARKFDTIKAHKQFAAAEAWRRENDVFNLYLSFDPDELESAKRFYPRWTGRRDKVRADS